jgi:hypothetical protein
LGVESGAYIQAAIKAFERFYPVIKDNPDYGDKLGLHLLNARLTHQTIEPQASTVASSNSNDDSMRFSAPPTMSDPRNVIGTIKYHKHCTSLLANHVMKYNKVMAETPERCTLSGSACKLFPVT